MSFFDVGSDRFTGGRRNHGGGREGVCAAFRGNRSAEQATRVFRARSSEREQPTFPQAVVMEQYESVQWRIMAVQEQL